MRKESAGRLPPLPLNRAEGSGFRRRALCVLALLALAEVTSAHAACVPAGTSHSDAIVCSGTQSEALESGAGDDTVSVPPGASVSIDPPASLATPVAINAGPGRDAVVNEGSVSVRVTSSVQAASSLNGCDLSRTSSAESPRAIGIAGGAGDDTIRNRGAITAQKAAESAPPTVAASNCGAAASQQKNGGRDTATDPTVSSAGIEGGDGHDVIDNSGTLSVSAASSADGQSVAATGIDAGNGDDDVVNSGTVAVTATATPPSAPAPSVTAVGIRGSDGNDTLTNDGTLTARAISSLVNRSVSLTLFGGEATQATTTVDARATGIDGGRGNDFISNGGTLNVTATSQINGLNVEGNAIDHSHGDTSTFIRSRATGIDAGSGSDDVTIGNSGAITATALSKSVGVNIELNLIDAATGDSSLNVDSAATGIVSGYGRNSVAHSGTLQAKATSEVTDVSANVSYFDFTIADRQGSDASTALNADAVGIDGTRGYSDIDIVQPGTIGATAQSTLHSVGISLGAEGVPEASETLINDRSLASIGVTANSSAAGILDGGGKDGVSNFGSITASATSTATQDNVGIAMALIDLKIPRPGLVLTGAGTAANANATGVDTGDGADWILNGGLVKSDATATAWARGYSLNIAEFSLASLPLPIPGTSFSLVVADTSSTATAVATGIDGGDGDDHVRNSAVVQTHAIATGGALGISATADLKFDEKDKLFGVDAVAARAVTTATSQAVGIDGGAGHNDLFNDGSMTVGAKSDTTAVGVGIDVSGSLKNTAGVLAFTATDTSSTATADATGVRGGDAGDKITDSGKVDVTANADAAGGNGSLTVGVAEKGAIIGGALARSGMHAIGTAVGIDGDGSGDEIKIESTGTVMSTATADADAVTVSVNVGGVSSGVAGGAALVDATTTATANATGVRTGGLAASERSGRHDRDDHDRRDEESVNNAGTISVDAQAHTLSVGVSADVALTEKGVAIGVPLAVTSTNAMSTAVGIEADGGDNDIANGGAIHVKSGAGSRAGSASVTIAGATTGLAGGAALTDSSVTVNSNATGVAAGAGDDRVTNSGSITFDQAESTATAASASGGVFVAEGAAIGAALARTGANATTWATAIDGGDGDDKLINSGAITMDNAKAHADAKGVSLSAAIAPTGFAFSGALVDGTSTATVTARGIDGGSGDDKVINTGAITLDHGLADAHAVDVGINLTLAQKGVALGGALVDAGATAKMTAAGISGGTGDDALINKGSVTIDDVKANSDAIGVSVGLTVAGQGVALGGAFALTGTRANAKARGIDGDDGRDFIYSEGDGSVTLRGVNSEAGAVGVSVGVSGGEAGLFIGAGLADASGRADTLASAIDGGARDDVVINRAKILVDDIGSDAHAAGVSVATGVSNAGVAAGVSIANTSGEARTRAKGIDGGGGDDFIWSEKDVTLQQVKSHADAVSVGVSLGVAVAGGVAGGAALSDASATATTDAVGIDGGSGDDKVFNTAALTLDDIEANTSATGVSVELGVTNAGVSIGGALADTHNTANADAKALSGGAGDDLLVNKGNVLLRGIKTTAGATSFGVTVNAAIEGGVAAGVSLTDASSHANTNAIGMQGGEGDDELHNQGTIRAEGVEANARATGVSVSVQASFAGIAGGAAIADTSGNAKTVVKGMDGGAGDDALQNDGTVNVAGKSKADAFSLGISVSGTIGIAGGAEITNANMSAETTATGLDGGRGRDAIANTKDVTATAQAETDSKAISVGVSIGVGGDASLADATTTAMASAVGIDGGAFEKSKRDHRHEVDRENEDGGDGSRHDSSQENEGRRGREDQDRGDDVLSEGMVTANATSIGRGTSAGGNLFGFALGKLSNTATARATGIRTDAGEDRVRNLGAIEATSKSTASGLSVAVNLGGKAMGDASTKADAEATGIATGDGRDEVENDADIHADARSNASANGVSVGLLGVAEADASVTSLATAVGINSGAGGDKVVNHGALTVSAGTPTDSGGSASCPADTAGTCARVSGVSVNLAGAGFLDATTEARSSATGISGAEGDDTLASDGAIDATARAKTVAGGVNVNLFGAAKSNAKTTAAADAVGVSGGTGDDEIRTAGTLGAASSSHVIVSNYGFSLGGVADFDATLSAGARGSGIEGGDGRDTIHNEAAITARATATVSSGGGSTVVFGASGSGGQSGALAEVAGIRGGTGDDSVWNSGRIDAASNSRLDLDSSTFSFSGTGGGGGELTATTRAAGITGDAGRDSLSSKGRITINAAATLDSRGGSTVIFGASSGGAGSAASTTAIGIDGGDDDDAVWNGGGISVSSAAVLTLSGSSYTFGGTGDVGGRLRATTASVGMQGGNGNDFLGSGADITVRASSTLGSSGGVNTTFGTSASSAVVTTDTGGTGMDGGAGDDVIKNLASVDVGADTSVSSSSASYVFGGSTSTDTVANASSRATGLRGGDGSDFILNAGEVRSNASASISGSGSAHAEFGGSSSSGEVASSLVTRGVDGGAGDDRFVNEGTVTAVGTSSASMSHDSQTGFLFGGGDSRAKARTSLTVLGADLGEGNNSALNGGSISVDLFGSTSASANSDGADIIDGDAFSRSDSTVTGSAVGIRTGAGDDSIENVGSIEIKSWRRVEIQIPLPNVPPIVIDSATGANADADADGDGIGGDGRIKSFATTTLTATGIDAGAGTNYLLNTGSISIDARARANATGTASGGSPSAERRASVIASAFGIRTGGGDDHVVNQGTISVTTRADNNTGSGDITASATGISTGSGNDTIINEGTITATRIVNGSSSLGTAISAGAGDDVVKLLDGSVTNGDIDLGSGNDSLSLEGTPVINGGFLNTSSTLSLLFNNFGAFSGGLPGVTAIKNGEGTFSLSMLNPMKRIEVNQGTLKLDNGYQFMHDGIFQAKVYGNGGCGQFYVVGDAGLDGKMKIVRGEGAYRDGTTFDVFRTSTAIKEGTSFAEVELPRATRLLKFHAEQLADRVRVGAEVSSFTLAAQSGNEMAVARNLDRILPAVSGDLDRVMGEVQVLPDAQFATAFASLSPVAYAGESAAALSGVQRYASVIGDRMTSLRDGELSQSAGGKAPPLPLRVAYNGSSLSSLFGAADEGAAGRSMGGWIRAFGQKGDRAASGGANGYEYDLTGISVGLDRRLTDRFVAGVNVATARNDVKADLDMSDSDIDSTYASLYGGYFDRRLYVNGALSYGKNDYDTRRNIVVGPMTTPVSSSHGGKLLAATAGVGYYLQAGAWWLDPFASLQYTRLREDGFTEAGSGAGLIVADRTTNALVSTLGARLSRTIESGSGGSWVPQASLAWVHDYGIDEQLVSASYIDAPDASFSISGEPIDRNGAAISLGIAYRTAEGLTTLLSYRGEFRSHFDAHGVIGELRYEF